jgi:tripartite-type tricarboxylate transporter receptor subunit TctC
MLRKFLAAFACLVLLGAAGPMAARGQTYPNKPIRLVVAYPAGGATDIIGRLLAEVLGNRLGQRIIVENRGGASGMEGARYVARSAPDGYTLIIATATTHAVDPTLFKNVIGYDAIKDFTPISYVGYTPLVLVTNPSVPVSNVQELLAYIKSKNGDISYANGGTGSVPHMAGELFNQLAGIKVQTIPYKGDGPATMDVLSGQLPYMFAHVSTVMSFIKSGKLKPLGVTTPMRTAFAPDIPTIAEQGLTGYDIETWWGLFGPAHMPKDIVITLNAAVREVLSKPEIKEQFFKRGYETKPDTPEEFDAYVKSENDRWRKIVEESGLQVN